WRHAAGGVVLRDSLEGPTGFLIAEGVQESHGARELVGNLGATGRREVDRPEVLGIAVGVLVLLSPGRGDKERGGDSERDPDPCFPHGDLQIANETLRN